MLINIKAGGAIVKHLPPDTTQVDVGSDASVQGLLTQLGIPSDMPVMVIVNSDLIQAADYAATLLAANDKVSLVQPIQAG